MSGVQTLDELLLEIRQLVVQLDHIAPEERDAAADVGRQLARKVRRLDSRLTAGTRPPTDWSPR